MKNIILVIGALSIGGFYYLFSIRGIQTGSIRKYQKAKRDGCKTTGFAFSRVYIPASDNHFAKYRVKYEYFVNGRRYIKKITYSNKTRGGAFSYPDEITLYYVKHNPRRVFLENHDAYVLGLQGAFGCLACIIFPAVLMAILAKILECKIECVSSK